VLQHTRKELFRLDELSSPPNPTIEDFLRERATQQLLEMALGMEADRRRPHDLDPSLQRELFAVLLVDLDPGLEDRLLRVQNQAVEVKNDRSNHGCNCKRIA
jgi:hypothetical protein